jgi:HSP20 family protein
MTKVPVELKKAVPATRPTTDPWLALRNEMDRLFDRFTNVSGLPSIARMFDFEAPWTAPAAFTFSAPAVDVTEDEKVYKVSAELPGMEEKDIEVTVTGDMLTLKGEKRAEKEEKSRNYYVSERSYGSFQRNFMLPEGVDRDAIDAAFAKGVLTVTLPKTAQAQKEQKKIEVKSAA